MRLEDGSYKNLAEYIKDMEAELLAPGTVMISINAEALYHPVLSSVNSPASDGWLYESSPAGGIKTLYVPTLEMLGANPLQYKLQARATVVALDVNATEDNVSVRVIRISDSTTVAGSTATGALNGENVEQAVQTGFFDITPGLAYFVDARKLDDNSTSPAALARQELFIQVVKK